MGALAKIRQAGFQADLQNGGLAISPASQLTPDWRSFLKTHKAGIIEELKQEQAANDKSLIDYPDDRHYCHECQHLNWQGRCTASKTRYHPVDDIPRRCANFSPA